MQTRDKERTRARIIDCATKEFTKNGFIKASTLSIARSAEVAHGTIFFHFPTKADLIIACIYSKLDNLTRSLDAVTKRTTSIKRLCRIYIKRIRKHERFYGVLVRELPLLPIKTQRTVFASLSGFSDYFVSAILYAQRKGSIRKFKPKFAMFYWFGMINYLYSYPRLLGTKDLSQKELDEIVIFFIRSIRKSK